MGLKYGCPVEDVLRAINTMQRLEINLFQIFNSTAITDTT